jgi:hypothetical protein
MTAELVGAATSGVEEATGVDEMKAEEDFLGLDMTSTPVASSTPLVAAPTSSAVIGTGAPAASSTPFNAAGQLAGSVHEAHHFHKKSRPRQKRVLITQQAYAKAQARARKAPPLRACRFTNYRCF